MANALTFIESNVEDLDKDQRVKKNAEELHATHMKLCKEYPGLEAGLKLDELSDTETHLMLQVL